MIVRPTQLNRAALIALVGIVLAVLPFLKGGFYIGKHEGDTLHLAELVLRMAGGEIPHLDMMTPIGILAIAPLAVFVKAGLGLGHAIFAAQALVALVLLLPALRSAGSRFQGWWAHGYAAYIIVLCLALVHGEAERSVSISMHYNRWAWAVAYIILPLALIAPATAQRRRPLLDGALIGAGMACIALLKVTYFVALAPAVLLALLARREWAGLVMALLAGLAVAGAVTLYTGTTFWLAYLADLMTVSQSDIRPAPGEPLSVVIASPQNMGASLALVATVILLRQSGRMVEGMAMLFLMPGLFYITYQNYGNDPQWLILLAMFAVLLRPEAGLRNGLGWDMRHALGVIALLAFAFAAPSAINLVYSPFRHLATDETDTVPLLPRLAAHDDIRTLAYRIYRVDQELAQDGPGTPYAAYREIADRQNVAELNGQVLPECVFRTGLAAYFELAADDLEQAGFGGKAILGTDLYSLYWAFGDFRTVKGSAPWYYGGLSGASNADYLVVPTCA
ncbi:MAG: hypothetical protein RLZZ528_2874, partial [Pseudomonadota bacterium]